MAGAPPNPSFQDPNWAVQGGNPGFADDFRARIRNAMNMGLPQDVDDQPIFHFADERTFEPADVTNHPYDWTTTPTGAAPKADVTVTCAIELKGAVGARGQPRTQMGEFDADEATLYFFEDEWGVVNDFTSVSLGQSVYDRVKRLPPLTIYDVQIEQVVVRARDEA